MPDRSYEEYRDALAQAFSADPLPPKVTSPIADDTHEGAAALAEAFNGKPWPVVPPSVLEEQAKNIPAFSLEAFRYYLPAFMAESYREPESEAATYTVYALVPLGSFEAFHRNTARLFSVDQARLIADLLIRLREEPSFEANAEEFAPAIGVWEIRVKEAG